MRIYISGHDLAEVNGLVLPLTEAGHEVASTWHGGTVGPKLPLTEAHEWRERAAHNFALIRSADALVLIGGSDRYPGGKYVEAGYANGQGIQVYNLGEVGNGMMHFAIRVNDVADLLAALQ